MKPVGCCGGERTPQSSLRLASSAQGTPFGCPKGEPSNTSLQTPYLRNLTACTSDTSKSQHYTYRQGQLAALTSPRRTASATSEFRRTVLIRLPQKLYCTEESLHRLTAVPLVLSGPLCPAGISPPRGESPLSGEACNCKLANAVQNNIDHLHQKTLEY